MQAGLNTTFSLTDKRFFLVRSIQKYPYIKKVAYKNVICCICFFFFCILRTSAPAIFSDGPRLAKDELKRQKKIDREDRKLHTSSSCWDEKGICFRAKGLKFKTIETYWYSSGRASGI